MARWDIPRSGLVSAALLTALTLVVFWTLQNNGPESAVRRFHEAIVAKDPAALERVITSDQSDPNVQLLASKVNDLLQRNPRIQFAAADRQPRLVTLQIVYMLQDGRQVPRMFVVRRVGRDWKVDADATVNLVRRSLAL